MITENPTEQHGQISLDNFSHVTECITECV